VASASEQGPLVTVAGLVLIRRSQADKMCYVYTEHDATCGH
jgi:hypothetical protein